MSDREKTKDELKAAAWKLAALTTRGEASRFLKELAQEVDDADWGRSGGNWR